MTKQEIEQAADNARLYGKLLSPHEQDCFELGAEFVLKRAEKLVEALVNIEVCSGSDLANFRANQALKLWREGSES